LNHEDYVLQAHHSRWTNFYLLGDARITRAETLAGIRLYDRDRHRQHRHIYGGHDPGVCACGTGANAAWLTGHADEALRLASQAIAISEDIEHPFSLFQALMWATLAAYGTRNFMLARQRADALQQMCDRHSFPQWRGIGMVVSGACRALAGETEHGLKMIGEGLGVQRQIGRRVWLGAMLTISASAHLKCGNPGRTLELLAEAIAVAEESGARVVLPETERLRAETLLLTRQIDSLQAIARIEAAAALAKQQGALALEWRAAMSLARLYATVGRHDVARELLRTHYAAFSEGFTSLDLVEGKQLLDGMS
jgi:predicted ATPase